MLTILQAQVNAVTFELGTLLNLMALTVSGSAVVLSTRAGLKELRVQIVELRNHFNTELGYIKEEYRDVVHRYGPLMMDIQRDIAILKTNDARRSKLEDARGDFALREDHK